MSKFFTHPLTQTLVGVGLLALASCATDRATTQLQPSSSSPATKAEVTYNVGAERDGNREIELQVQHLPPPSELGDNLNTFVVWMTPMGSDQPQNVGQLDYDPSDREGTLDIITPYDKFTLSVTAEQVSNPLSKSEHEVASGTVDARHDR